MADKSDAIKPHAIMVEFLFQGHITPFIHLAVALASKGCTVTYVQTEFIHHLMSKATSDHHKQEDFIFSAADLNFVEFYESILRDFPARVDELVGKIVESDGRQLKPFLVADAAYLWPPAVAAKYHIANVSFWTQPALRLCIGHHLELLKENGVLCSYGDYKDHIHDIPGVKSSSVRDFITYAPAEDDPYVPPILRDSIMKTHLEVRKADFILCNTVQELEFETISALNQKLPTYAIGPTNFIANFSQIPIINSLRSETDCTQWLNTKPPGSVLFVSFGSIAQTDKQVIWEIARGLCTSRVNFVWVLRSDAVRHGGETDVLPPRFESDISDRGLIIPWCNQGKVLSNPAIGGFLTHCGWSSVLESIWFGVPVICYPIFMDQPTNRNMVVDDWKIGINLCDKPPISKDEVAEKINSLMSGTALDDLRQEMKKKVSKIVHNALAINGSSDRNLDKFLKDLKGKIGTKSRDMSTSC
ncbi:hypothetical protein Pfo_026951 [Paulownia fortunei]|nr:hypothetical protein Pfo_026951 [Paulownia fortunei]